MRIIIIFILLLFSNIIYCEENLNSNSNIIQKINLTNSIGVTSSSGLSYRYWPDEIGVQFSIFPFVLFSLRIVKLEFLVLKKIFISEWSRFSIYAGLSAYYNNIFSTINNTITSDSSLIISLGAGICIDIYITRVIYIPFFLGYNLNIMNNTINTIVSSEVSLPCIGLYFEY